MSQLELILLASSLGILFSRTTLLEKLKFYLTEHKCLLIVKALDCSYCSSFWSAVILNLIFFSDIKTIFINAFLSALIGYYIGKGE